MKLNILLIICLINYVFTFPDELFDELWQTNQSEPQTNNKPIESQPKIKVESNEEQFDGRWQDESALKGNVKVEHGPHYGAVKVEGTVKIKHESADELDQANSNKHLSDQNNSTDQDESVDEPQNESKKCKTIKSDQQKREIIQKFRQMKNGYRQKGNAKEWTQIETKISNSLGVCRSTIYKWIKELGLNQEIKVKSNFSELEKRQILKQFDEIKSKCKKAKLKNISMRELDEKIAKTLGICRTTISEWKREFGLSVSNKISDATKIGILKKYAEIKRKNPKMSDCHLADLLKISIGSLRKWKAQFRNEIKHL